MPIIIPTSVPLIFLVTLNNFPEWAIPMTKVIPIFYVDDGNDASLLTWTTNCRHWWHVVSNTDNTLHDNLGNPISTSSQVLPSVELRVEVMVSAKVTATNLPYANPIYVDVDLVFFNENIAHEVNPNKS